MATTEPQKWAATLGSTADVKHGRRERITGDYAVRFRQSIYQRTFPTSYPAAA